MTFDLLTMPRVTELLAPAKILVDSLPRRTSRFEQAFSKAAEQLHYHTKQNPSNRTYYLGKCGRVSQRKQLVGEVIATVRACNTDQARYLFSQYETMRTYPVSVPKPFIGKPVLCKCGWFHSHTSECPVCANWKHIGQQIVAGEAEA